MALTDMGVELDAIVGGVTYDLTDLVNSSVLSFDGFGMAPLKRLEQQGPMQHGVTDIGFRLNKRYVALKLRALANDNAGYWAARAYLLNIFKPTTDNAPIKLRFSYPTGQVRQLDCHISTDFGMSTEDRAMFIQTTLIELYAPDPTWYDPSLVVVPFQMTSGGSALMFPYTSPLLLGASDLDQSTVVNNPGSWITYPIITIEGPITDPIIINETTGETLDFTPNTIAAGEIYTVDCRYEHKTIFDQDDVNQISKLTQQSDLATFHLQEGNNSLNVSGSSVDTPTRVYIQYYPRYIGV